MAQAGGEIDVRGKVAVVTGANTGIGRVTALELAERGARVLVLCRSEEKGTTAAAEIRKESGNDNVEYIRLDLASMESVRRCAAEVLDRVTAIHLLVLNAGVASHPGVTEEGFEHTFGVNHLGHHLLAHLLLPAVQRAESARIVVVSSDLHRRIKRFSVDDPALRQRTATITGLDEYGTSKLANILFANELARRLRPADGSAPTITVNSLHPGGVATDIYRRIPACVRCCITRGMMTPEQGATTTLYLCLTPALASTTGQYYVDCKQVPPTELAQDEALAGQLWRASNSWCGIQGEYGAT